MLNDATETVREAFGKLQELAPRLTAEEALFILALAESRAAYRDDSFEERLCDLCSKPYRGPAVYCCFNCAINDSGTL